MPKNMPVYIVAAGPDIRAAASLSMPCVYLVYSIGAGGALVRAELPVGARGGLLGLSDHDAPIEHLDLQRLCRDLMGESSRRGYGGILLDFERRELGPLAGELSRLLSQRGVPHYVPLELAAAAPGARVLVPSSISGGSFEQMLRSYCRRFDPSRLALDVVRLCNQYPMPSYDPDGTPLSARDFHALLEQYDPTCFFSKELCAKYFTYHTGEGAHFVLYDDVASTWEKIAVANRLGFCGAFVLYRDFGTACRQLSLNQPAGL